jgi:hypothetical protein
MTCTAGLIALIGCTATPPTASAPVEIAADEFPRIFQASLNVLRDEGFVIDQQDYRFGTITTKPATSATFGEPWYGRRQTPRQAASATINDQRRVVTVTLEPADKADKDEQISPDTDFVVRLEVMIEQFQVTTRFLTGSARGRAIFGHLRKAPTELEERGISDHYWMPVTRDPYMEQRLLERIVRESVTTQSPAKVSEQAATK